MFKLILITAPEKIKKEHAFLAEMFALGLETLHVRKPDFNLDELREWLQVLPEEFHARVMLHSHHELAQEFKVKGLHFPEWMRSDADLSSKGNRCFSTSFHKISEITVPQPGFDYGFLSPVFDSISKEGYLAAFPENQLKNALIEATLPVIALGGISAKNLENVAKMGFAGAAVLGAVWQAEEPVGAFGQLRVKSLEL